jgi:hypothetical protein
MPWSDSAEKDEPFRRCAARANGSPGERSWCMLRLGRLSRTAPRSGRWGGLPELDPAAGCRGRLPAAQDHSRGRKSARHGIRNSSAASPTMGMAGAGPSATPRAVKSASRWPRGRLSASASTGRSSWCSPANENCASLAPPHRPVPVFHHRQHAERRPPPERTSRSPDRRAPAATRCRPRFRPAAPPRPGFPRPARPALAPSTAAPSRGHPRSLSDQARPWQATVPGVLWFGETTSAPPREPPGRCAHCPRASCTHDSPICAAFDRTGS